MKIPAIIKGRFWRDFAALLGISVGFLVVVLSIIVGLGNLKRNPKCEQCGLSASQKSEGALIICREVPLPEGSETISLAATDVGVKYALAKRGFRTKRSDADVVAFFLSVFDKGTTESRPDEGLYYLNWGGSPIRLIRLADRYEVECKWEAAY